MSEYIVSARKYRPQNFLTVVGQKSLVQTLKNAIASEKLAHAYLFCGPRGVGKTTCARIFAKTINCEHRTAEGEACEECESCRSFREQRSYNVYELDAASNNSVDNIRELIEQVQIPPQIGRYKVFIIDEVHMLSNQAFNAFLKTLEEPPKHAIFIMCTTEKQKILPTILSRCQTYDFQRITQQDIAEQLRMIAEKEQVKADPQALMVIARKADGGMRDALSIFDQIASFTAGNVSYQATIDNLNMLDYDTFFSMTDAALRGDVPGALVQLDQVIRRGFDPQYFIGGWAGHFRDLMVAQDPATLALIDAGVEMAQRYQQQTVQCKPFFLYNALQIANDCDFNYRNSRNKRLSVEIAVIRICQLMHPLPQPEQPQRQPLQSVRPQQGGGAQAGGAAPAQAAQGVRPVQPVAPAQAGQTQAYASAQPAPARVVGQAPAAAPVTPTQPRPAAPAPPQPTAPAPSAPAAPTPGAPVAGIPTRPRMMERFADGAMAGPRIASIHAKAPTSGGGAQMQAPDVAQTQEPEQNEPVDEDALWRTWIEYASGVKSERLLHSALIGCRIALLDGLRVEVQIAGAEPVERIRKSEVALTRFLRSRLRNSHLKLEYKIIENKKSFRAYTPREKFEAIMQGKEAIFQDLVETFGLEFA